MFSLRLNLSDDRENTCRAFIRKREMVDVGGCVDGIRCVNVIVCVVHPKLVNAFAMCFRTRVPGVQQNGTEK